MASQAVGAATARVSGLESDAVADLEVRDLGADLDDGTGGLVAEDHGVLDDEVANGAVNPVVHVGAADARVVYGDEDIVGGAELGLGALSEGDIVGLVEDEGEVLPAMLAFTVSRLLPPRHNRFVHTLISSLLRV